MLRTIFLPPLFRHSLRVEKQPISPEPQEYQIVHGLQTVLDPYTAHFHGLWTLWGVWIFQQYIFWVRYLVNQEGGGCMVATRRLGRIFHPKDIFFVQQTVIGWLNEWWFFKAGPSQANVPLATPTDGSTYYIFSDPNFFSFHSNSLDIKALYHWLGVAFTGSFLCKYTKQFKGATSLGRHICPVCN